MSVTQHLSRYFTNKWLIVAILTIVAVVIYYFTWRVKHKAIVSSPDTYILLQLPGGDIINLTTVAGQTVQTRQAVLHAESGVMTFTPTAASSNTQENTLSVPKGLMYRIVLSDGTQVYINAASRLKFPFSFTGKNREVYLEGESYFAVASHPDQPFIVHTPYADVKALGTSFNIETYDSTTTVSLLTGRAQVAVEEKSVILLPGQAATLHKQQTNIAVEPFEGDMILNRLEGKYLITGKSIYEISRLLERWYNISVIIDQEKINSKRYYGVLYKSQPIEFFLEDLKATSGIEYFYKEGELHLKLK